MSLCSCAIPGKIRDAMTRFMFRTYYSEEHKDDFVCAVWGWDRSVCLFGRRQLGGGGDTWWEWDGLNMGGSRC